MCFSGWGTELCKGVSHLSLRKYQQFCRASLKAKIWLHVLRSYLALTCRTTGVVPQSEGFSFPPQEARFSEANNSRIQSSLLALKSCLKINWNFRLLQILWLKWSIMFLVDHLFIYIYFFLFSGSNHLVWWRYMIKWVSKLPVGPRGLSLTLHPWFSIIFSVVKPGQIDCI